MPSFFSTTAARSSSASVTVADEAVIQRVDLGLCRRAAGGLGGVGDGDLVCPGPLNGRRDAEEASLRRRTRADVDLPHETACVPLRRTVGNLQIR